MPRPITQRQYETLAALRQALRRFLQFSHDAARAAGVPPQQHQALLAIKGNPRGEPLSVRALAERLQLKHHSAVGLVDRLVRGGFVQRRRAREDRRRAEVTLTARGERLVARLSAIHRDELRQIGPQLRRLLASLDRD